MYACVCACVCVHADTDTHVHRYTDRDRDKTDTREGDADLGAGVDKEHTTRLQVIQRILSGLARGHAHKHALSHVVNRAEEGLVALVNADTTSTVRAVTYSSRDMYCSRHTQRRRYGSSDTQPRWRRVVVTGMHVCMSMAAGMSEHACTW